VAGVANLLERLERIQSIRHDEPLSPALVELLYGKDLETSVSQLEQFAACPFKFFVSAGLGAEERRRFELDMREQGSFLHKALELFHKTLSEQGKRWRDLEPQSARERIAEAAATLMRQYREGLLLANGRNTFTAHALTKALQDFVETAVSWMQQYEFNPEAVELGFGLPRDPLPAWKICLDERHQLVFRGKIDRADLWRRPGTGEALAVVIDYKSNTKKLDPVLLAHGIQLQLAAYLNVLGGVPEAATLFGLKRIVPAGVFYVTLRARYESGRTRGEVLEAVSEARKAAYKHVGRFDAAVIPQLDRRNVPKGDQFNYFITQSGELRKRSAEALDSSEFRRLLQSVEENLTRMGRAIFSGKTTVDPYRKGFLTACEECRYQGVCRIDPWTHLYRTLKNPANETR
jgi:ATP-dependent helicase/nuclease subunit B